MKRRAVLLATCAMGLALGACSTLTKANAAVAAASSDVTIIANGLGDVLTQLGSLGNIPADVISTVTKAVSGIKAVASSLSGAATETAAQPLVQQIEGYVNAVVSTLAGLSNLLPSPITLALQGASVLLPVIEGAIGMLTTTAPTASAMRMTSAEARLALTSVRATK